eukprot:TRINITY_DN22554_c0_g1_i1.p2 TRINITY_DN22554_c0_g1~~TRINITY_DN22554_c0_g1_i1.p2  ORF type:complete len:163 (+),score=21.97 TRINITY_DN22554_c0_g1_i1:49-489(+)
MATMLLSHAASGTFIANADDGVALAHLDCDNGCGHGGRILVGAGCKRCVRCVGSAWGASVTTAGAKDSTELPQAKRPRRVVSLPPPCAFDASDSMVVDDDRRGLRHGVELPRSSGSPAACGISCGALSSQTSQRFPQDFCSHPCYW